MSLVLDLRYAGRVLLKSRAFSPFRPDPQRRAARVDPIIALRDE
jgi:hypothetical protein